MLSQIKKPGSDVAQHKSLQFKHLLAIPANEATPRANIAGITFPL